MCLWIGQLILILILISTFAALSRKCDRFDIHLTTPAGYYVYIFEIFRDKPSVSGPSLVGHRHLWSHTMSASESNRPEIPPSSSEELDVAPTHVWLPDESSSQLATLLDEFLAELQAGRRPDRQKLLDEHPDLAMQLEQCLSGIEFIHQASLVRPAAESLGQLGDFRIVREVGRGGMGVVYEAEQVTLKRRVALKVLRYGAVADSEAMQRFQREAETVATLHHTNIVPIFAIGCENGVNYYAMQFIEGQSLADVAHTTCEPTSTQKSRPATEIANWGLQAAEALAHAHRRGVIHRDIKPSNLILDPDGRIWLTDFGLAKRIDDVSLSLAGAILGTPRYMSPEQAAASKNPIDHRTDIYSLGATLYELATGRPLFQGDSLHLVITQILSNEPPSPRAVCPNLHRDFETIILKCLAKEPERRYPTAQALADDLRAFVEGRAIRARRSTFVEQTTRWFRQQKQSVGIAAAAAAATIFVIVGGVIAWQMRERAHLGYVTLNTPRDGSEGAEVAEVLRADSDESVGSPFTLPTKEPLILPEGAYRLRLTSPSKLSQDYLFDIAAGQQMTTDVGLVNETLGNALPLKSLTGVEIVAAIANARDVASVRDVQPRLIVGPQEQNKPMMRCYLPNSQPGWNSDGTRQAEIQPLWEADWRLETPEIISFLKLPEDATARQASEFQQDIAAWQQLLGWFDPVWWRNGTPPKIMQSMSDLNGDGTEDAIWTAPRFANPFGSQFGPGPLTSKAAVLIAVSGKDGQPIWWFRPQDAQGSACRIVSDPVLAGSVAVLALRSFKSGEVWIEGVETTAGKSLWRSKPLPVLPQSSVWLVPTTLQDGDEGVIVAGGTRMFMLEARTGRVRPNPNVSGAANSDSEDRLTLRDNEPILDARFADFDGNGSLEAILTVQTADRGLRDIAVSVADAKPLWEVPSSFKVGAFRQNEARHSWPLLADLDNDGKLEVILPGEREYGAMVSDGCRVLDAMTGRTRWTRRFPQPGGFIQNVPEQFSVGPDVDGDGQRELVMVSIRREQQPRVIGSMETYRFGYSLFVDCYSGRDGKSLWWQRIPFGNAERSTWTGTPAQPLWWNQGGTFASQTDSKTGTATSSVTPAQTLLNGSALLSQSDNAALPRLVLPVHRHADRGGDGSGNSDAQLLFVLNAATGRIEHSAENLAHPQIVDWNGDGLDDLAVFVPDDPSQFANGNLYPDKPGGQFVVLRGSPHEAFRRLDPWVEEQDFDGDGIKELSRPFSGSSVDYSVQIASGRDGHVIAKWPVNWLETPRSWAVGELHSFPAPLGDFDGNGLADVLLTRVSSFWDYEDQLRTIVKTGRAPLLMQAISGKSGQRIWGGPPIPIPAAFLPTLRDEDSNEWQLFRQNQMLIQSVEAVDLNDDGQSELLTCLVISGQRLPAPGATANIDQRQQFVALINARSGSLSWIEPMTELIKSDGSWLSPLSIPRIEATSDLSGDGVRDFNVVVPQPGTESWSYTIQARSGRDGKALWGPKPSGKWSHGDELKMPNVGDLDGDGRPELVLLDSKQPMVVKVLSGDTGEELWKWNGAIAPGFADPSVVIVQRSPVAPPQEAQTLGDAGPATAVEQIKVANTAAGKSSGAANRQRCVAVTINETGNQWELVLLDHAGQVVERIPYGTNQLWSHDLDGDGGEELLRFVENKLTATRSLHDMLWTWSPAEDQYADVSYFDRTADGHVIVGLRSGDAILLLDGATGEPLGRTWRSTNSSLQENNRWVDFNHADLATPFENSRLLTRVGDGPVMFNHIVSRLVLPADEAGRFRHSPPDRPPEKRIQTDSQRSTRTLKSLDGATVQLGGDRAAQDDPRLIRQLPWVPPRTEWSAGKANMLRDAGLAVCLSFVVMLIPFWLIRAGVRRKELGWRRVALIAAGATVFISCLLLLLFRFAPSAAIWRDLPWALPIAISFAALPGLLWIATLMRNLFIGEWRHLSWLLGGSFFAAIVLATLALSVDASQKPSELRYSWQAWWFILPIGAQAVGTLLFVWKMFGPGWLWLWNFGKRRLARNA